MSTIIFLGGIMLKDRIRSARISRGFTLQQMADELQTGLRNYQKYESGHTKPTLEGLAKIADFLNVSTDYLLCRDEYLESLGVFTDGCQSNPPRRPKSKQPQ